MMKGRIKQGDIFMISLAPTLGSEIQGKRPVLVLSNAEFNRGGRILVAAITQGANLERIKGWTVTLIGCGTKTQGAIVVSQSRMLDFSVRNANFVETVPNDVIDEVMAKFQALIAPEI